MLRLIAAVALALLVTPAVARACSCGFGFEVLWPELGATEVPLNTRIWIAQLEEFEIPPLGEPLLHVFGETTALEFTTSTIDTGNGPLTVLTPLAPLAPMTRYELLDCAYVDCVDGTGGSLVTRFITGTTTDTAPPPRPVETGRDGDADRGGRTSCGKSAWARVEFTAEGLVVMQLDEGTLDPEALLGEVSIATLEDNATVGRGACFTGWPDWESNSATVRYGAFDLAGNFSGWTEPDTLTIGRGCGCRSDAPGAPSLLLLTVAALALRRRRRQ